MDFFQQQQAARKKTSLLVAYFLLAVVMIIISVYFVIAGALAAAGPEDIQRSMQAAGRAPLWSPELFAAVAAGTSLLVGGGSLYKIAALSGGGHTVAELLGGRPIAPDTTDPDERRVLNVVEEMAIAAGTTVPPVYLLDQEEGINAFAAGHAPGDAVIGVTRGTVRSLNRDELQGVIAHEFSHILNGDMRLNIRLMGVLFGILLITTTGWIILRSTTGMRYRMGARGNNKGGNPLPLIGLALIVIGWVGVFFGRLIKAAVSRQREYLADASAVQFTRNPDGIAGALKKIGAYSKGSKIENPEAEEASHMFFGNALGGLSLLGLMATHPPLVDRIRRIDPSFDGDFSKVSTRPPAHRVEAERAQAAQRARAKPESRMRFNPAEALTRIGTLGPDQLAYAAVLLEGMPQGLVETVHEPFGANATVYALLLDPADASVRARQLDRLAAQSPPAVVQEARRVFPEILRLDPRARLPLAEMALPALRQLSTGQFRELVQNVRDLTEADERVNLFEYAMSRMLLQHLGVQFGLVKPPAERYRTIPPLVQPTALVLSALAHVGQSDDNGAVRAFKAGVDALGWPGASLELQGPNSVGLKAIDDALNRLAEASPPLKKQVLAGCAACIGADGQITLEESELLRAVSDALDCPMPPLLAGTA